MFDIGFSELVVIGVIALIVIGPERLPEVARVAGKYVGRMRRLINKVRDDIEREVRQDELREALKRDADLDEIKSIINDSRYTIENEVSETREHVVKAREDDPRADVSQQAYLHEQDKDFDNEDYGLTDHRDYAEPETGSPSAQQAETTQAEPPEQSEQTNQAKNTAQVDELTASTAKQDDGSNEQSRT